MEERLPRKLAAVLYADIAGYSRLTGEDEDATHHRLREHLDLISESVERHRGRIVHYAGDAVLAMFEAVVDALSSATHIQGELQIRNANLPDDRKVQFRIGVNLGDVIEDRGDIYGEGVNVAARLESLAEPGGICISDAVRSAVGKKLPISYEFMGEQAVKNISEPVRAYRVSLPTAADTTVKRKVNSKHQQWLALVAGVLVAVAVAAVLPNLLGPGKEPTSDDRAGPPLPAQPSIAVLPFDNLSTDAEQEYFVDGMTEDLITDLSKNPELFVISRNSSFAYKGKSPDARDVARKLGVRYLLEGSVRKVGKQVRINAQLIDATTGGHVWADRYDGTLDDVFALQDEVTQKILVALAVNLASQDGAHEPKRETQSSQAYDLFLKGWAHYRRQTPEHFATAHDYFLKAIHFDPDYGRAHAALASMYWRSFVEGFNESLRVDRETAKARTRGHLAAAMRNPTPLTHQVAAQVGLLRGRHEEALREAEHAVQLDPNDADSNVTLAEVLIFAGRPQEAIRLIDRARRLDPLNDAKLAYLEGLIRFSAENFKAAAESFERAIELNPELWAPKDREGLEPGYCLPCEPLASAYGYLGRQSDAERVLSPRMLAAAYYDVSAIMYFWPFKKSTDFDRMAEGLRKAGVPD